MKFEISSSVFLMHLQAINRVINSKNQMPILDNFLFNVKGNKLTLTASDGETTMVTKVELSSVEGQGTFAVPAKTLLDPLRELPDQLLTLEINMDTLEINILFPNGKYNFIGVNGDEYPTKAPIDPAADKFTIEPQALLNGITKTIFATYFLLQGRSDQISHSVMSDTLRTHESQHDRFPCPLPTPGVHSC